MRSTWALAFGLLTAVPGCVETVGGDAAAPQKQIPVAATSAQFAQAGNATNICSTTFPNEKATQASFLAQGYKKVGGQSGYKYFRSSDDDVTVIIGKYRKERICIVGLKDMSAAQSYKLAQKWAQTYGAKERSRTDPSRRKNVAGSWVSGSPKRLVLVSAYKTWQHRADPFPKAPGASVRLIYEIRG